MKAIILAGGEGTRLRPLSICKPKPMLRLFDRPLLEHIVLLLRNCGFTELCMTLHYLPQIIQDHFGDGSELGVSIEYRTEAQAAGTAGSVLACRDFAGKDDVLVVSGDAACSYDLRAMMEKHRLSGADATVLVQKCSEPSEFGLVLTEEDGRVKGFVEKPGPEKIVSDLINTGIYVLSPAVFSEIPEGRSADFGGEVFPNMLRRGLRLHTWQSQGYWNDVGSCDAYRATCRDVLDGRFPLPLPEGKKLPVQEPCWISPEAVISPDCQLGPYTVIGSGSCIGSGCRISGSVLDGAFLQADCTVEDSILSRGVHLGREVQLRPGCVLAEEVSVGAGSLLRETLRIWPGLTLSAGNVFAEDQLHGPKTRLLRFQTGGIIAGENGLELTPERFLRMGRSCAGERIGVSAAGGSFARLLAEAFLIGAGADGKTSFLLDAPLPAAAAATAGSYGLDQCLFFLQEGDRSVIYCFDRDGLPIPRKDQRKMEASLSAAEGVFPTLRSCSSEQLTGSEEVYLADVLRACGSLKGWKVSCPSITFRRWLARTGTELCAPEDGVLQLKFAEDGFTLSVVDELGRDWPWSMLLCAMAAAELRCGEESVVLPYDALHLAERVAEEENGTVYRLDRDGEDARKHWRRTPWCRDGLTLTMRLLSRLKAMGLFHLSAFMDTLPEYHSLERVVRLDGIDTAVLRMLSRDREAETVNGVLLRRGEATASVRRQGGGDLRILAESVSMEAAEAFCDNIQRRIRQMGSETQA